MKYYKFLTEDNRGGYSGLDYTPYLPKNGKPGKWLPKIPADELVECDRGYHACKSDQLLSWLNVRLYEVKLGGKIIDGENKSLAQRIRFVRKIDTWNDKTARLYACWCAEQALPIYERDYPDDRRPREAIEVAARYASGIATAEELAAAGAAAGAAARAAAGAAARDAAWAAAWAAARAAARDAAWDAAWAAARAAARAAQSAKLVEILGLGREDE